MKPLNLNNVEEAKDFETLPAGGYVCRIVSATDMPQYEMLKLEYDIVEGQYANYFNNKYGKTGYWFGDTVKSYKESALPYFKQFITCVEKSNPGYHWNNDEHTLVGKLVGFVIGDKEYRNKTTGEVKITSDVAFVRSVEAIRKGDFKVPELKKLKEKANANSMYGMPASFAPATPQPTQNNLGSLEGFVTINPEDVPF